MVILGITLVKGRGRAFVEIVIGIGDGARACSEKNTGIKEGGGACGEIETGIGGDVVLLVR